MENPNQNTPIDMEGNSNTNNKKNISIAIVVLIIIILAGWMLFTKNGSDLPATGSEVEVTEDGTEDGVLVGTTMPVPAPGNAGVDEMIVNDETVSISNERAKAPENAIVYYGDGGFLPKTLTITPGRIVTFVNRGSNPMWVASASHPAHDVFPEFDQLESVSNGGTYIFTFDEIGTWNYHNHVRPGDWGTIIVE